MSIYICVSPLSRPGSFTFNTRLASVDTSCPSSPNRRSTASATQPFPAMARQEPPLSSRGLEEAQATPLRPTVAASTKAPSSKRRSRRATAASAAGRRFSARRRRRPLPPPPEQGRPGLCLRLPGPATALRVCRPVQRRLSIDGILSSRLCTGYLRAATGERRERENQREKVQPGCRTPVLPEISSCANCRLLLFAVLLLASPRLSLSLGSTPALVVR